MFSKFYALVTVLILFTTLCSMSQCGKEDLTPQPETIIQGIIKDPRTGNAVPDIKIVINKRWDSFFSHDYTDVDSIYTKADGSYYLKFTPLGAGTYKLIIKVPTYSYFQYNYNNEIKIGSSNKINFSLQKGLYLNIQLKNLSDHGRKYFRLSADSCCAGAYNSIYNYHDILLAAKDTNLTFFVPHSSSIKMTSLFYNTTVSVRLSDTLSSRKIFKVGKNDTTVSIINP